VEKDRRKKKKSEKEIVHSPIIVVVILPSRHWLRSTTHYPTTTTKIKEEEEEEMSSNNMDDHAEAAASSSSSSSSNSASFGSNIHISSHPVLFHKISVLRSINTPSCTFRSVLKEVTYHLGYEATKTLSTKQIPITVKAGKEAKEEHIDCMGYKIIDNISLITILRSGLGMTDAMLELLPKAAVHHIGMYRMPGQAPVQYFNKLPKKCTSDVAFVLDPVIGSSATVMAVVAQLKKVP
jgi:uracil phosphoribosyltransferase